MKRITLFIVLFIAFTCILGACNNKQEQFLCRKWDCVKIDNLDPARKPFLKQEDSLEIATVEQTLQTLNWNFFNNGEYQCATADKILISGNYLLMNNKTLICTPRTKNNINRYTVLTLSEDELVLSSLASSRPLVLHFKPH